MTEDRSPSITKSFDTRAELDAYRASVTASDPAAWVETWCDVIDDTAPGAKYRTYAIGRYHIRHSPTLGAA